MAGVITLNNKEMDYILSYLTENAEVEEMEVPQTLFDKKYLKRNDNGEILFERTLLAFMEIMQENTGCLILTKSDKNEKENRLFFLFKNDSIVTMEYKDGLCELMLLPYLPLAVGKLANYIGEFKNDGNSFKAECSLDDIDEWLKEELNGKPVTTVWDLLKINNSLKEIEVMRVWESEQEQLLGILNPDSAIFSKPDKLTWIHQCTKWMTDIHGAAIKAGGRS